MKYLLLLLLLLLPLNAVAGVNRMNGNFYITYTDIYLDKATPALEITRTYNSMSSDVGWFGTGWGSNFETRLIVTPEGSVLIRENGNGAYVWFTPEKPLNIDGAAASVVAAMRKKGAVTDDAAAAALQERLKGDADLRALRGVQYGVQGTIPEGTVLRSAKFGAQELRRTKDGFVRSDSGGAKVETFSDNGQLVRLVEKGRRTVEIAYLHGRVQSIADNHGQKILMEWTADGFVKSLGATGQKARANYRHQGKDLVESVDVDNNRYLFGYDAKHNLTSISYQDGRKLLVEYDPKSSYATKVTDKDGSVTEYRYGANPKNPDLHYWTEVVKTRGDHTSTDRQEYEYRIRANGTKYPYRTLFEVDGEQTETVYSEHNEAPIKIVRRDKSAAFAYDAAGNLIKRESSDGSFSSLEYHPTLGKLVRVEDNNGWSAFSYDILGNLIEASNQDGALVKLNYDADGRITTMIDASGGAKQQKPLTFKYNRFNKPAEITIAGLGAITVTYDDDGNVRDVESAAGPEMVQQIMATFQKLLVVIEPSGVKLEL